MKFENIVEFARFLWGDAISDAQITVLRCLYGLDLTPEERSIWRKYAGTRVFERYRPQEFREATLLVGRQAGKSAQLGTTIALWETLCVPRSIPSGERQTALILTPTLRQSTFGKVAEKLRSIPELAALIETDCESAGLISLRNGVDIQAVSAIPRFARGFTAFLVLIDEASFIRSDGDFVSNLPELLESVRPTLVTTNGKLILMSSPGSKGDVLHTAWETRSEHPEVFVFKAPSKVLNPTIPDALLAKERKRGDAYFRREFLAEFVDAANPFLNPEALEAAIAKGAPESRPPERGDAGTSAAIDLSDLRVDSCALSISAARTVSDKRKVVQLFAKEWPAKKGGNVLQVLEEMGEACRTFKCTRARGDQRSMSVAEAVLAKYNVQFQRVVTAGQGSEESYRSFSALLNNGQVELLDHSRTIEQLRRLEEKTSDGKRFLVEGRRNSHDDLAVVCVQSTVLASQWLEFRQLNCGGVFG